MLKKPLIHVWIYNHPFYGISDQLEFFLAAFRQHGYQVSVGRQPKMSALNVVIENFSKENKDILIKFCQTTNKSVVVIMTEHLDFIDQQLYVHGSPLWTDNDYMHPITQVNRIGYLMECRSYILAYFTLGDLPELRGFCDLLPGADVRSIPFPKLDIVPIKGLELPDSPTVDLTFTGVGTEYRNDLVWSLKERGFSVYSPWKFMSRKQRDTIIRSAKLVLNIPQRVSWPWLSLMRVISGLRSGRATISLGTIDSSKISACSYQLDLNPQRQHLPTPDKIQDRWDTGTYLLDTYRDYSILKFTNKFFAVLRSGGPVDLTLESDRSREGNIMADDQAAVYEFIDNTVDGGDPRKFEPILLSPKDDADKEGRPYMSKWRPVLLSLDDPECDWSTILWEYLAHYPVLYERACENYMSMASEYERSVVFPHDMIEYWAIADRIATH